MKSDRPEPTLLDSLTVPPAIRKKIRSLGSSIAALNEEIALCEEAKDSLMSALKTLAAEHDLPDVKLPDVFSLTLCNGKTTLKEQRLLEEGVTAATIEACKEQGNPYWQVKRLKTKR